MEELTQSLGAVPVDTRSAAEYAQAHLPQAINVPLPDIGSLPDLLAARAGYAGTVLFILYDQNTPDAVTVGGAMELEDAGYRGVVLYTGGLDDWTGSGRTTEP